MKREKLQFQWRVGVFSTNQNILREGVFNVRLPQSQSEDRAHGSYLRSDWVPLEAHFGRYSGVFAEIVLHINRASVQTKISPFIQ